MMEAADRVQTEPQAFAAGDRVRVSLWSRISPFGHDFTNPDTATFIRWDDEHDGYGVLQHRANGKVLDYLIHWRWIFAEVVETVESSHALTAEARQARQRAELLRAEAARTREQARRLRA